MSLKKTIRKILREEYSLPPQVRRRLDLSESYIILHLRDLILRGSFFKTPRSRVDDAIYDLAWGMMHDAGLPETEFHNTEVHGHIVNFVKDNFGEYAQNFYDEVYNGDDNERYIFYKHADRHGGNGFTEGITGWYNFLHKFGYWFPMMDWPEIKEKIKSMPRGHKLLLSSPGDSNNGNWGYYFSMSMK